MTPEFITAATAGAGVILTALGGIYIQLRRNAAFNEAGAEKLDTITVLVNGRYTEVLKELAEVKLLLALMSGKVEHAEAAKIAAALYQDSQARILVAQEALRKSK